MLAHMGSVWARHQEHLVTVRWPFGWQWRRNEGITTSDYHLRGPIIILGNVGEVYSYGHARIVDHSGLEAHHIIEQSNLVAKCGSFSNRYQDEHSRQAQLANLLLRPQRRQVMPWRDENGCINLRSMAVSMDDMMRFQAAMVNNPGMPVAVDLPHYPNYDRAAQMIVGSGNTLNSAAIAIQKASEQLQDVLDAVPTAPHMGKH